MQTSIQFAENSPVSARPRLVQQSHQHDKSGKTPTTCPCCGSVITVSVPLVDLNTNCVSWNGKTTKLTPKQAEIMTVLVNRYPSAVAFEQIVGRVWGSEAPEDIYNNVRTQASYIRKALRPLGWTLYNIHASSYRLVRW